MQADSQCNEGGQKRDHQPADLYTISKLWMHHTVHQWVIKSRCQRRCWQQVVWTPGMCPILHVTAIQETAQSI